MKDAQELGQSSEEKVLNSSKCYLLTREQINHYWNKISFALDDEPELWNRAYTKEDLQSHALAGLIQVWVVDTNEVLHICFMTERCNMPNGLGVLRVFWMWGENLLETIELIDLAIDKLAAYVNCSYVEVAGRKAFEKLGKPLGYKYEYSVLSRPVREQRGN